MNKLQTDTCKRDRNVRVLIVADNASTEYGGEAFLPLMYFKILKKRGVRVCLVTHARNRKALVALFGSDDPDLYFLEDTVLNRIAWRLCKLMPSSLRDVMTMSTFSIVDFRRKRALIRGVVRDRNINVIHQPTPVSPRFPSQMHAFGVHLVIGPMNGGMRFPRGFEKRQNWYFQKIRRALVKTAIPLNLILPGKRRAHTVLVANERTRKVLPVKAHPNVITLPENGIDVALWGQVKRRQHRVPADPFRLVYLGALVKWKAVDITLDAVKIARVAGVDCRLMVIGSGSEDQALRRHCTALGLQDVVKFLAYSTQDSCAEHLARSDALILNSLYECGGAVVLEAMAAQLPVVASDWGGPADYLDETCGILVPPSPHDNFADRLARAIYTLAQDPDECEQMGVFGHKRALKRYDWETKVDRLMEIYSDACASDVALLYKSARG